MLLRLVSRRFIIIIIIIINANTNSLFRYHIQWQCDNYNRKYHKYVCITTNQPDTKSNPDLNRNPNPTGTAKQHAIVNIQLNIVTLHQCAAKIHTRHVVAPLI